VTPASGVVTADKMPGVHRPQGEAEGGTGVPPLVGSSLRSAVWIAIASAGAGLWAQTPRLPEYKIKAKFLIFIAQAASRLDAQPLPSAGETFRIGVFGRSPFEGYLGDASNRKTIGGRPVELVFPRTPSEARSCHLLFICQSESTRYREILEWLKGTVMVTVGDDQAFINEGGTVAFRLAAERVEICVSTGAAKRAGVAFEPSFLSLVRIQDSGKKE
jgi:hypothetical protein